MKVCWQLAFLSVLASSLEADCRRLNGLLDVRNKKRSDELISFEYLVKPSEKEGASFGGRSPKLDPHRYSSRDLEVESRTGTFGDIWPYIGSFVYRSTVRTVFVQPAFKGVKRIVPKRTSSFISQSINKKYIDLFSPLQPMLSSYAYKKLEQTALWGLHRGFIFFRSNFFQRRR